MGRVESGGVSGYQGGREGGNATVTCLAARNFEVSIVLCTSRREKAILHSVPTMVDTQEMAVVCIFLNVFAAIQQRPIF